MTYGYRYQVIDPPEEGLGVIGPPPGSIRFNPSGVIPLPAIAGDTLIFSFRVPIGYDGVILGQYHGATFSFSQGSGLIAWRISADRRYLKDCGNMIVSLGTNPTMSPIMGGLVIRSNNLIRYEVNNLSSGSLPNGNILAGLGGYFWPRT